MDLFLPTGLIWICLFPPLPSSSPQCSPLSGGVIYLLGCPGLFLFLCIFEVSLNLGISSSIFSVCTFLYLLIHFRCLCRSPITPCLSDCSFWDFLTHINTVSYRKSSCCISSMDYVLTPSLVQPMCQKALL